MWKWEGMLVLSFPSSLVFTTPPPYHTTSPPLLPSSHISHNLASITTSLGVGRVEKRGKDKLFQDVLLKPLLPCGRCLVPAFLRTTCMASSEKNSPPKDHSLLMWETLWLRWPCSLSSPPTSVGSADGQYLTSFCSVLPRGSMCPHLRL